jgi:competence protein ComEC
MKKLLLIFFLFCFLFFLFLEKRKVFNNFNQIVFFNLKEGESTLIKTKRNQIILIDTGLNDEISQKISGKIGSIPKRIDYLFITHADKDHYEGTFSLLKHYKIKNVFLSGAYKDNLEYEYFLKKLKENKLSYYFLKYGDSLKIEDNLKIEVLNPFLNISQNNTQDNNDSLVFKIYFNKQKILFTGDIEEKTEKNLLKNNIDLKADILKVPHHGSNTSSSLAFIKSVKPKMAVFSAGYDNFYNFPKTKVLERYKKLNIEIINLIKTGDFVYLIK